MKLKKQLAALTLAALATTFSAGAANIESTRDWPQFHGPNRDNISHETGLLKEWPSGGPPLAWKVTGTGGGFSSVSVANGKIFTAGDEKDSSYVYALNEADGKQLWKSKLGGVGGGGQPDRAGTRATPTVDGDLVYMIGQFGDLACYQAADGKEVWRTNLTEKFGGKIMSKWGNSESILVDGDKVICTPGGPDGTLVALDKKTGQPVWRTKDFTDFAAYMAPVVTTIDGVRQAVVLTDRSLAGVAVADGKLLWRIDRAGKIAVIPTPVIKDNYIYVTSGYGVGCDLFKVVSDGGKFNVEKVYANTNMVNHHGGVVLVGDCIYGYSDKSGWTCQDLKTGDTKWTDQKILGKGTVSYADGLFYLRDEKTGKIVLMQASPEAHAEKGRFEQPERSRMSAWAHLVIANGHLYVRDQDEVLCFDIRAK
jgi:outer membrane protein assembly factor BamB